MECSKAGNGQVVRGVSPIGKEKAYGGKDLPKSQVLSSEWKTEVVTDSGGTTGPKPLRSDDFDCFKASHNERNAWSVNVHKQA